jgi:mono/diheme cytochrome c family protein
VIKSAQAVNPARGIALIGNQLLSAPPANAFGGGRRGGALSPEQQKLLQQGSDVFGGVCFSCHGADGLGQPMAGAAPGTTMAPPLAGSPRVQAHRDYVIKVLLNGLAGPVNGKTYPEVMVPMGATSDEWVAGIASYIRNSFGNNGGLVTPADVARVRRETAARKTLWTVPELEASLPRVLDPQQWKLTASHGVESAAGAVTLRGWSSGAPQAAGMWFQIDLSQPVVVSEVQFDSSAVGGQGGGRARGAVAAAARGAAAPGAPGAASPATVPAEPGAAAAGAAPAAGPAGRGGVGAGAPPVVGYPRGYSIQASLDGTTWSQPLAEGKGEGPRTSVTFAPTRARFLKITQTATAGDAPSWSITSLRVYEAPAGGQK